MSFTTQPPVAPRRIGRGLRILAGITMALVGLGFLGQFWLKAWWGGEEEPPSIAIRPAAARLDRYELPEPTPEIQHAALPVVMPAPAQREPAAERPRRLTRVEDPDRPKPIRLGEVAFNIQPLEVARPSAHDGRLPKQWPGCALRPGPGRFPAVLDTAIFSEQGGQVVARVTSTLYSPDVGYQNKPLVRQGTEIVGYVEREQPLSFGRRRLGVIWTEMHHTDGFGDPQVTQVNLGTSRAASVDGSGGIGGRVEVDWGAVIGTAVLATIFNIAQRPDSDNLILDESGRTVGRIGEDIVERTLDAEPKILIDAGTQVWVMIQQTVRVC